MRSEGFGLRKARSRTGGTVTSFPRENLGGRKIWTLCSVSSEVTKYKKTAFEFGSLFVFFALVASQFVDVPMLSNFFVSLRLNLTNTLSRDTEFFSYFFECMSDTV